MKHTQRDHGHWLTVLIAGALLATAIACLPFERRVQDAEHTATPAASPSVQRASETPSIAAHAQPAVRNTESVHAAEAVSTTSDELTAGSELPETIRMIEPNADPEAN